LDSFAGMIPQGRQGPLSGGAWLSPLLAKTWESQFKILGRLRQNTAFSLSIH
jgi:hypothetical protein